MKSINDKHLGSGRRSFLKKSGLVLLGSTLFSPGEVLAGAGHSFSSQTLKVGLIGCGGRGTGAAAQALKADSNVLITAMGDVFEDRLMEAHNALTQLGQDRVQVPADRRFVGFDAYQKVIDSGVDVVLLTTPPGFRPPHLAAAIAAGKHVFCEKPVAVDAPGVRMVLESAKLAKQKNLSIVSGFCFRYDFPNRAVFSKVLNGDVGEIKSVSTFRNGGELWYFDRQPDWTQMTYQMRNWYYYNWLSGDFIAEQSVHSLDMMSWVMGDEMPVSAMGTGGRQVRIDPKYGNIYDHFAIEYEYANGQKGYHFTRQQSATANRNSVDVLGTQGNAIVNIGSRYEINGKENWKYTGEKNNMYQTQHDELFAAIRSGNPINDGEYMAKSTMLAIWGRMVAYTGERLTWDQAFNSTEKLGPNFEDYHWDFKYDMPPIAVPGQTKFS